LFEYYQVLPEKHLPDTLDEMQPLFAAVAHGCAAGLHQRALDEVYYPRIVRNSKDNYVVKQIGALGVNVQVLANFFSQPWNAPVMNLTEVDRSDLLNWAAFSLKVLGRSSEAIKPLLTSLDFRVAHRYWVQAAINAGNLSELYLGNGMLSLALDAAQLSVLLADKDSDGYWHMRTRTTLADAQHQVGELAASHANFVDAEILQKKDQPNHPQLYSVQGFRYCDLLLTEEDWLSVQKRSQQALEWVQGRLGLLDTALDQLSLGRASLQQALADVKNVGWNSVAYSTISDINTPPKLCAEYLIIPVEVEYGASKFGTNTKALKRAYSILREAVAGFRQAGHEDYLPGALLARASLHRFTLSLSPQADSLSNALRDLE
jgi:hypothetical protein